MPRLFAVLAGCNYVGTPQAGVPVLAAAEDDARQMAALLAGRSLAHGDLATVTLLLGQDVTTASVRAALDAARARQTPDDTLLFYYSGHGAQAADGLTLYLWDAPYPARDLIAGFGPDPLPAALVLDCCHAGAIALSAPDAAPERP